MGYKLVAGNPCAPILLFFCQLMEVCLGVTKYIDEKEFGYNIALQVTGVDGTLGFLWYYVAIPISFR